MDCVAVGCKALGSATQRCQLPCADKSMHDYCRGQRVGVTGSRHTRGMYVLCSKTEGIKSRAGRRYAGSATACSTEPPRTSSTPPTGT
eukprot:364671-Chlamydomonas_euryale.AAC.9